MTANVDDEFRQHLAGQAVQNGFSVQKQANWIRYHSRDESGHLRDLLSQFPFRERHRALDLGCGFGANLLALEEHFVEAHGIEIDPVRAEWASRRSASKRVVCGSATDLPYPDNYFDFICAPDVFEHVNSKQQKRVAAECFRVLSSGHGFGYITVPSRSQLYDAHNYVWFGSWLPDRLRRWYVLTFSRQASYETRSNAPAAGGAGCSRTRASRSPWDHPSGGTRLWCGGSCPPNGMPQGVEAGSISDNFILVRGRATASKTPRRWSSFLQPLSLA